MASAHYCISHDEDIDWPMERIHYWRDRLEVVSVVKTGRQRCDAEVLPLGFALFEVFWYDVGSGLLFLRPNR